MRKGVEVRITLVSLVAAVAMSVLAPMAGANTNPQAEVTVSCPNQRATIVANFNYTGMSVFWHLTAHQTLTVGNNTTSETYEFDGPSGYDTMSAPAQAGTFTITATTEVYGGNGRLKATGEETVTCERPPSPPPDRINPSARFWGPCGDPYYRAVLNNRRSDRAVVFEIKAKTFRHPNWTYRVRVPAHRLVWTGLFDAAGGTRMTIKWVRPGPDKLLAERRAAPNRIYKPCPTGVPVIG